MPTSQDLPCIDNARQMYFSGPRDVKKLLLDAERLIRLRGIPSKNSFPHRLRRHMYTHPRIMMESTNFSPAVTCYPDPIPPAHTVRPTRASWLWCPRVVSASTKAALVTYISFAINRMRSDSTTSILKCRVVGQYPCIRRFTGYPQSAPSPCIRRPLASSTRNRSSKLLDLGIRPFLLPLCSIPELWSNRSGPGP